MRPRTRVALTIATTVVILLPDLLCVLLARLGLIDQDQGTGLVAFSWLAAIAWALFWDRVEAREGPR